MSNHDLNKIVLDVKSVEERGTEEKERERRVEQSSDWRTMIGYFNKNICTF